MMKENKINLRGTWFKGVVLMILLLLLPLYGFAAVENTAKSDTVATDSVKKRRVVLRTNLL